MFFRKFLETHWTDIYPAAFHSFRKRWFKTLKTGEHRNFWVQFTDYKTTDLDRGGHHDPNHHDPIGNYAYPLKYVLEHPADIWYGRNSKYLRLLRGKAKRYLQLNNMSESLAKSILRAMGIPTFHFDYAMKHWKFKGVNAEGKAFLAAVQQDLAVEPEDGYFPMRSPGEQTNLFLKAGYDAVYDESRNEKSAVMNSREPQQIVFLTRHAFEVVEIIPLHHNKKYLSETQPDEQQARKLAALILDALDGDKIIAGPEREIEEMWFWSRKGRRISVVFSRVPSYYQDKKMGQKKHKESKLHDPWRPKIILYSERGIVNRVFSRDAKFSEVVREMVRYWREKEENKDWQPETLTAWQQRKKEEQENWWRQERENRKRDQQNREKLWLPRIQFMLNKLHIPWTPKLNRNYFYTKVLETLLNMLKQYKKPNAAFWDNIDRVYNAHVDAGDTPEEVIADGWLPKDLSKYPDLEGIRHLIIKMAELMPQYESWGWFALSEIWRILGGIENP